jgi:cobalt-zinc-cadmium resistance protein CzcA
MAMTSTLLVVGERIEAVIARCRGAADVKLEQVTGLPLLTITPDREALARLRPGWTMCRTADGHGGGWRAVGQLFEGDRRFDIVVRLPEATAQRPGALADLPIPLPGDARKFRR